MHEMEIEPVSELSADLFPFLFYHINVVEL